MPVLETSIAALLEHAEGSKAVAQNYEPEWVPNPAHSPFSPLNSYSRRVKEVYAPPAFVEDAEKERDCGPLRQLRWADLIGIVLSSDKLDSGSDSSLCPQPMAYSNGGASFNAFAKAYNSGKSVSDAIKAAGSSSTKLAPVKLLQDPKTRQWKAVERTIAQAAAIQKQLEDAAVAFVQDPGPRATDLEKILNYWRSRLGVDRFTAIGLFLRSKGVALKQAGKTTAAVATPFEEPPLQAVSVKRKPLLKSLPKVKRFLKDLPKVVHAQADDGFPRKLLIGGAVVAAVAVTGAFLFRKRG